MKASTRLYQSYLLRMWKENAEGDWRSSLQDVSSGECSTFISLDEMFVFLRQRTAGIANGAGAKRPTLKRLGDKE